MPEINNMQKKMVYLFLDADPHRTINRSLLRRIKQLFNQSIK